MKISTAFLSSLILLFFCCSCVNKTSTGTTTSANKTRASQKINHNKSQELNTLTFRDIDSLPTPPEGFKWQYFKGIFFRIPIDWNTYSGKNKFSCSAESITDKGEINSGLMIISYSEMIGKDGIPPSLYAKEMIQKMSSSNENTKLQLRSSTDGDDLHAITYKYRYSSKSVKPTIIDLRAQYNDQFDIFNMIAFQAPEEQYEKYWKNQGKIILGKIVDLYSLNEVKNLYKTNGKHL